ncbi:T9SS type A sorting domain-containing protein, partial [Chryseobacterium sp. PMSZPI]
LITDIRVYPNPVKDILHISNTTSEDYKIFDMGGKLIDSGKLQRGTVNVSSLIKGAYMLQIGEIAKRFIKN